MIEEFYTYIKKENLIDSGDRVLLTISGGIDSMTMLDLFMKSNLKFSLAHCNFSLRGAESDGDQEFLERFVLNNKLELFSKRFDTVEFAKKNNISIQMAARDLRYTWFNKIADEYGFTKIATAHNLNDVVETFFINLTRGTGIHGLTGIKPKNNNIIRPLLFAKRKQIKKYSFENNVSYREDSSNAETKYLRNAIRHKIIPVLEELNPSFIDSVGHTTTILKSAEDSFNKHINEIKKDVISTENGSIFLSIDRLTELDINPALLFELLNPYGFTFDTITRLLRAIKSQPGKVFYSHTHKLVIDRKSLIIQELSTIESEEYLIAENQEELKYPLELSLKQIEVDEAFSIVRNRSVATFDADKLCFPLKLRRWKHGDIFHPFGMKGKKKLSDYFTDQKLSIIAKENIWILCCGEEIIWVVNHRSDNRYMVTKNTKRVLQIELNV